MHVFFSANMLIVASSSNSINMLRFFNFFYLTFINSVNPISIKKHFYKVDLAKICTKKSFMTTLAT